MLLFHFTAIQRVIKLCHVLRNGNYSLPRPIKDRKFSERDKAFLIASKADNDWRLPVLMTERMSANRFLPQSERNPLVTLRKITLMRMACSLRLFVGGTSSVSKNRNKLSLILLEAFFEANAVLLRGLPFQALG